MASIILGAVGAAIGGKIGGTILGVSAATIGGFVGSAIGGVVDQSISALLQPGQRIDGARLDAARITSSTEGAVIPRLYGRARLGGNVIWATDFREETRTTTSGGKGGGPTVTTTEYTYFASFALGLCEGPIAGIGRVWADGKEVDLGGVTWRWYPGDEAQEPDVLIAARMGADSTPAYRGLAYVVFEDLALAPYGNRLPQLSFEVFRTLPEPGTVEAEVRAVTMIPGSGEFVYATEAVRKIDGIAQIAENQNASTHDTDFEVALDRLIAALPALEMVSLVVSWFGDDLRCGSCRIRPCVETSAKNTSIPWSVNGVTRGAFNVVSQNAEARPIYGGTPADFAVVQAIRAIKARGLRVTFYPFILMDVPPGNTKPNPYSANAAATGQPVFPWRGRITCSPAAGFAGTVDKTVAAATQVDAFFGIATAAEFATTGTTVVWTGSPTEWGLRRMILHYAHLCVAAGGVDAFLIGTEMRGLTTIRSAASTYPAVAQFVALAADVKAIVGAECRVSYAADWSEYFGHQPADGSGDVHFHLDPIWSSPDIAFVGIDNYMPLSDWRDGFDHADAQAGWSAIHDRAYLQANIEGGEGWDWFYPSDADRAAQTRSTITDGAHGKPWVFRYKALRDWWQNQHFDRPGGVEIATPTAWVPQSKPIVFAEYGCPAIDRGTNQPNVFVDPKSSESFVPYFSRGWRDDAIQRAYLEATLGYWGKTANNPTSLVYDGPMIDLGECAAWTWDARPYPTFPAMADVWTDRDNWRLGHWLTGRAGSASIAEVVRDLCRASGLTDDRIDVSGVWGAVEGYAITQIEPARAGIEALARHFGFDAFESGGAMRFRMRGRAPALTLTKDDLVADGERAEPFELARAQESELPQALKWQIARADESYDRAVVEARRIVATAARVAIEAFPFVVPVEEADRRCRRALLEAWCGREAITLRLPPSRLALDPADVIRLAHDGRALDYRVAALADREARSLEGIRQDRAVYDIAPGVNPGATIARRGPPTPTAGYLMDLPQLREDVPAHRPWIALDATPWPGDVLVYRSATFDGWRNTATVQTRAQIGMLFENALPPGPLWRFDNAAEALVLLYRGSVTSAPVFDLLGGANALAVRKPSGRWEVIQFATVSLYMPGTYRVSRLLRGQLGTDDAAAESAPAGSPVVILNEAIVPLPLALDEIGTPLNWRIGPASRPISDPLYVPDSFTPSGRGLLSFSPAQPRLRRLSGGDLRLRWLRRIREPAGDNWALAGDPLPEGTEAYDLEIMDGAVVKRAILGLTVPAFLYTNAMQTADWGGPVAQVAIRLFQIGPLGRGVALEASLAVTEAE